MKTILFLCTGNYYRSRFAEEVFNFHAKKNGLAWRADSAGLKVVETRLQNPGPISHYTIGALEDIQIVPEGHSREPKQAMDTLLESADLIIATSLVEHKPMVEERIPQFANRINYWEVEDIEFEDPKSALQKLYSSTLDLIDQLEEPLSSGAPS